MTVMQEQSSLADPYIPVGNYLVPRGAALIAAEDIRLRKGSRTVAAHKGALLFIVSVNVTFQGGVYYQLQIGGSMARSFELTSDYYNDKFTTKDGDAVYDGTIWELDQKPFGWYGVDWYCNDDDPDSDQGYIRLRRMVRI